MFTLHLEDILKLTITEYLCRKMTTDIFCLSYSRQIRLTQFLLYTVTDQNTIFSGTPVTNYMLSFRKSSSFHVDRKYHMEQLRDNCIILFFNSMY